MAGKSLIWMLLGLALAFGTGPSRALAAAAPLPAGTTACNFDALAADPDPAGLAIRAAPSPTAQLLGRLPVIRDGDATGYGREGELAQFRVVGSREGWLLIEGASYPEPSAPKPYAGRGWVDAKGVTTHLYRDTLKASPSHDAADIVYLNGSDPDGIAFMPYVVEPSGILGCAGDWFEVELWLPGALTPTGAPATPDGAIRGWTDRSCTQQQNNFCAGSQFDYPWSRLPAGITECSFGALSRDPDPAGLDVHGAPEAGSPVIGRLPPPTDIGDDATKVLAEVRVIGFRKGWFLVEAGPYETTAPPAKGPKPFIGRGWVAGDMLTTELLRDMLKQAPRESAADIIDLEVDDANGNVANPQSVKMRRILACSGDWLEVEIELEKGMVPLRESGAPPGAVRGWANGACTEQLTTCDFNQDRPWSPPAPLPPE